jgi:hypothetical protein
MTRKDATVEPNCFARLELFDEKETQTVNKAGGESTIGD